MAVVYSNSEMADMHFIYGKANGSALRASQLYAETYPNRTHPDRKLFSKIHQRLSEHGNFKPINLPSGRPISVRTPEVEEMVLESVEENPQSSCRRIAQQHGIRTHSLVWQILHDQLLYPYHLQRVQALLPCDFEARTNLSRWISNQQAENPLFISNILFTDEASFTRNGINNFHNRHVWAEENPHAIQSSDNQHRFSLNVWGGIFKDKLFGPVFLPGRLNGQSYLEFLVNTLPELLENTPLEQRETLWFMHDGAPAHFSLNVRRHLNNTFGEQWIGRGGPVAWPPRSPDLNPLDFYLWGHLKSIVYARPVNTVEELSDRIRAGFQQVRANPGIFERVRGSMLRRIVCCVQENGRNIEHLL